MPRKKPVETKTLRCDFDKIQEGDFLSETQFYRVTKKTLETLREPARIYVQNERGFEFGITRQIVEEGLVSANQFVEQYTVGVTRLAEILAYESRGKVVTVCFHKKLKESDSEKFWVDKIHANGGVPANKRQITSFVKPLAKEAGQGEERIMVGYVTGIEPLLGYSNMIDLEKPFGEGFRRVNHAGLKWIICDNVKYTVG